MSEVWGRVRECGRKDEDEANISDGGSGAVLKVDWEEGWGLQN